MCEVRVYLTFEYTKKNSRIETHFGSYFYNHAFFRIIKFTNFSINNFNFLTCCKTLTKYLFRRFDVEYEEWLVQEEERKKILEQERKRLEEERKKRY